MRENEGFDILHNGLRRTFRDQKAMAYEAARFAKTLSHSGCEKLMPVWLMLS